MMEDARPSDLQASYDRVADEYARRILGELDHKPLDRQLLDRFALSVQAIGSACEVGCGPGQVARYLHDRGLEVCGVDLSSEMVEQARKFHPVIEFRQADMRSLGVADGTWGGVVAFYSVIHVPPADLADVLLELKRVLRPGGVLLVAFHIGDNVLHLDEWWGQKVSVDFFHFQPEMMATWLVSAGFEAVETIEREPYPDVEHPSRRAYLFARKPVAVVGSEPENDRS